MHADGALYAALVDGKVAVKLGPGSWSPSDAGVPPADGCVDWALVTCGNEFAVRAPRMLPPQLTPQEAVLDVSALRCRSTWHAPCTNVSW